MNAYDAKGSYENLARRITRLRDALDEANLQAWLSLVGEGKGTIPAKESKPNRGEKTGRVHSTLADAYKQIDQLLLEVTRLQGLRYNLWALTTIYRAQQSSNWDGLLGKVDVGLLQPTVSALYSSTYDSLIGKITEPRTRIVAVQNVLNGKKAGLSSF